MEVPRAVITGTGLYVPPKILRNSDLEKIVDTSDEWIRERTGISQRHVVEKETTSDLAARAAEVAIKNAQSSAEDIDCIIFCTTTGDYMTPASAAILQDKLGIKNSCACFDLSAACSGFLYGMAVSNSMIQSGLYQKVLLIGAEVLSHKINWEDRKTCVLFADGAGAVLVENASQTTFASKDQESKVPEIFKPVLTNDSKGKELIQLGGGSANPIRTAKDLEPQKHFISMQGQETFKEAVRTLTQNSKTAIANAGLTTSDIDWFIPHQANLRIINAVADRLKVPHDKAIINIEKYGNTSAATIPMALHEGINDGRIKRGDIICCAAFGAGLSSGAVVLRY